MYFRGYNYYANQVYTQSLRDNSVDSSSVSQMSDYSRDMADMLCLNADRLSSRVTYLVVMHSRSETPSVSNGTEEPQVRIVIE